eukprot:Pgem_evm6s7246
MINIEQFSKNLQCIINTLISTLFYETYRSAFFQCIEHRTVSILNKFDCLGNLNSKKPKTTSDDDTTDTDDIVLCFEESDYGKRLALLETQLNDMKKNALDHDRKVKELELEQLTKKLVGNNNNLREQLNECQSGKLYKQINHFTGKCTKQQDTIEKLNVKNQHLQSKIKEQDNEIIQLNFIIETKTKGFTKLTKEHNKLKNTKDNKKQLIEQLQKENSDFCKETVILKRKIAALEAKNYKMQGRMDSFTTNVANISEANFSHHALKRIKERRISVDDIRRIILDPDHICMGYNECMQRYFSQ